ncbi:MAG: hypothetical protein AB7S26_37640 [Sandaracinaceae bacterium]
MSRPCPRILVLDRLGPDLGSQSSFVALLELLDRTADAVGVDLAIDQSRLDALPLRPSTIATINASYDLVVVTGADVLSHDPRIRTASGWALDLPIESIEELTAPLALFGVGSDAPAFQPDRLVEVAGAHLARTARHARMFTVRDEVTEERLHDELGIDARTIGPVELAIRPLEAAPCAIDVARRPVAVSLQLDATQDILPFPFQFRFETLIRTVVDALEILARDEDRQIVYAPHTWSQVDIELERLLAARLPEGSLVSVPREVPALFGIGAIERAATLAAVYRDVEIVVGHRIPSITLPFVAGTPTVAFVATDGTRSAQSTLGAPEHRSIDLGLFDQEVRVPRLLSAIRAGREHGFDARASAHVERVRATLEQHAAQLVDLAVSSERAVEAAPLRTAAV